MDETKRGTAAAVRQRLLESIDTLSQTTRQKERAELWQRIHADLPTLDMLERERDEARADSAALLERLQALVDDPRKVSEAAKGARDALAADHPGAAWLAEAAALRQAAQALLDSITMGSNPEGKDRRALVDDLGRALTSSGLGAALLDEVRTFRAVAPTIRDQGEQIAAILDARETDHAPTYAMTLVGRVRALAERLDATLQQVDRLGVLVQQSSDEGLERAALYHDKAGDDARKWLDAFEVTAEPEKVESRRRAMESDIHPSVVELLREHPGHIIHWGVRCITCAPTKTEAMRYGLRPHEG